MKKVSTVTVTLLMVFGLALSSCGKKGALETPPAKDKKKVSSLSVDGNHPLSI